MNPKYNCSVVIDDKIIVFIVKEDETKSIEEEKSQKESCKITQQNLPQKEVNPGVVIFLVSISDMEVGNTLIDLGVSVNIIPLLVVKKIGDLKI